MQHPSHLSRSLRRGFTHLELAGAIALLAMVAGGITAVVKPGFDAEKVDEAERDARRIRDAVAEWQTQNDRGCPTISQLIYEHHLSRDARTDDPWGGRYRVQCSEDETVVSSAGRDGQSGTEDDIRVPTHRG